MMADATERDAVAFACAAPVCTTRHAASPTARRAARRPMGTRTATAATLRGTGMSRRTLCKLLALPLLAVRAGVALGEEGTYEPITERRYVTIGRPAPDAAAPQFAASPAPKPFESPDGQLRLQDVERGTGTDDVIRGALVSVRYVVRMADGTTVDDGNAKRPVLFRPGAHQVPPGIEDAVIGMRLGGRRRVNGSAERILT